MKTSQKLCFLFAVLVGIFIFYISSLQRPPNPFPTLTIISILYHFGVFFLFALFVQSSFGRKKYWFFTLIFSGVYAALDEIHQYYVPGRSCTLFDFGTDFAGCLVGLILALIFISISKKK